MEIQNIQIKQVLDIHGTLESLELWQGDSFITITLQSNQLDSKLHTYKWNEIKKLIDTLQTRAQRDAAESINREAK